MGVAFVFLMVLVVVVGRSRGLEEGGGGVMEGRTEGVEGG